MKTKIKSVYIASPYSPCTQLQKLPVVADLVRRARFHRINLIEAHLTDMTGYAFVCPITQSHTLARYVKFDEGFASWKDIDFKHIRDCDEVWVIMMKDWDKSIGVQAEIRSEEYTSELQSHSF